MNALAAAGGSSGVLFTGAVAASADTTVFVERVPESLEDGETEGVVTGGGVGAEGGEAFLQPTVARSDTETARPSDMRERERTECWITARVAYDGAPQPTSGRIVLRYEMIAYVLQQAATLRFDDRGEDAGFIGTRGTFEGYSDC